MCMKSWLKQGIAHLDASLLERTVVMIDSADVTVGLEESSDVSDEEYDSMLDGGIYRR
jgi:hypothetical protein